MKGILNRDETVKRAVVFLGTSFMCKLFHDMWDIDEKYLKSLLIIEIILLMIFVVELIFVKMNRISLQKILAILSAVALFGLIKEMQSISEFFYCIIYVFSLQESMICIINLIKVDREDEVIKDKKLYKLREINKKRFIDKIKGKKFTEDSAYTIAIHDEWGRGKTFFLEKAIKELQEVDKENKYYVIKLDTMLLNEEENLLNALEDEFVSIFKENRYASKFNYNGIYIKLLGDMLQKNSYAGLNKIFENIRPKHSLKNSRKNFKDIIKIYIWITKELL